MIARESNNRSHGMTPSNKLVLVRGLLYVGNMALTKQNHAAASSQVFARHDERSILHIVASTVLP
jgi:hypothetical protein